VDYKHEGEKKMSISVRGSDIEDSGKKIGVINGRDILTYPGLKSLGHKDSDGEVFDASGHKVGYGDDGIVKLFLK
jgi:hypothetical protein